MDKGEIYHTNNFGRLVIVEYYSSSEVLVRFLDTGFETITSAKNIRNGTNIRDKLKPKVCGVGFTGDGIYGGYKDKKAYKCWEGMIYRCYNKDKYPSYAEYFVCDSWLNFQNFAKWYYEEYIEGYELDKGTSKVYSPNTCRFVSKKDYSSDKVYLFENTSGRQEEVSNRAAFCRKEGLDQSAVTRLVKGKQKTHKGWRFIK